MVTKRLCIVFTLLLSMVGAKTYAYEFEAKNSDGITIYYDYFNNGSELKVTCEKVMRSGDNISYYSNYSGNIVIPEEVTYLGRTRKVTCIGDHAFSKCKDLVSVTIPISVTTIEMGAFEYCSGLTSIIIPQDVSTIGTSVFYGCSGITSITIPKNVERIGWHVFKYCDNLLTVISLIENPFDIKGASTAYAVFSNKTFYNATLYVPYGTIEKYKATEGWKDFLNIKEGLPSTSIDNTVINRVDNSSVFNLNGQCVGNSLEGLSKGIYIKSGKKQVVK